MRRGTQVAPAESDPSGYSRTEEWLLDTEGCNLMEVRGGRGGRGGGVEGMREGGKGRKGMRRSKEGRDGCSLMLGAGEEGETGAACPQYHHVEHYCSGPVSAVYADT
jgi:hypothetical protein